MMDIGLFDAQLQKIEAAFDDMTQTDVFERFFHCFPLPMWIKIFDETANKFKMFAVNTAYCEQYKIDPADYIGKTDDQIWGDGLAARFLENDLEVLNGAIHRYAEESDSNQKILVCKFPLELDAGLCVAGVVLTNLI